MNLTSKAGRKRAKKVNKKLVVAGLMLLFFLIVPNLHSIVQSDAIAPDSGLIEKNIKLAESWVLPAPIVIDELSAQNWTWAANTYGWCSGNGSVSNPYLIENVTIDGMNSGSCVSISNSRAYFLIRNCTLFNSSIGSFPNNNAGIKLVNTTNGQIMNNDCSNNQGVGVNLVSGCYNNNVSENIANNNQYGIFMYNSDNNTISRNIVNNNQYGIYLYYCDNNTVSENFAITNSQYGMYIYQSNINTLSDNNARYNSQYGIYLKNSEDNTVSGNNASNNRYGLYETDCYANTFAVNNASNNANSGIYLKNGNDDTVSGNIMINNKYGIYLSGYNDAILYDNDIHNCGLHVSGSLEQLSSYDINTSNEVNGKPLYYYADKTGLGTNNFTNAGQVLLINCNNSVISGLNTSRTSIGISLYYCSHNIISENYANDNTDHGIYLRNGNNNMISGNTVNNNANNGIYLIVDDNNTILGNILNKNADCGIYIYGSNDPILYDNDMHDCGLGVGGSLEDYYSYDINISNEVNGKSLYYYVNKTDLDASNFTNAGQVFLINCNNSVISGLNISRTSTGISLYYSSYNLISENYANDNTGNGIYLRNGNNNTISGNTANNNQYGIYLHDCNNSTVSGNIANNNMESGVYIYSSDINTISGNNASYNTQHGIRMSYCNDAILYDNKMRECGLSIGGSLEEYYSYDINISNEVNGKPLYYYVNKTDLDASNFTNAGQVFLINCNNSVISGLNTSRTSTGISLYYSSNNLISENYANDNTDRGISLSKANNNNISGNILINNDQYGLFISLNSENNKAWLNSFLDNGIHANDDGTNNQWDNGSVGNFWDDYEGVDTEEPYGIGDISYFFENGEDRFPLMDTVPNVNFIANATNIILGGTIQFTYTGTGGNIPLAYEWDFGDGNDSSERDPVHRYGWNDTFLVSLTVTDIDGDSDTNTTTIIVELDTIPVASFGANATHIVEGQGVQFYYNGTGGNAPLTYEWYFGDETPPSNETNPVHVYAMNGTYTVNLTVIDVNGDSSNHSIEGYIEVEDDTIPALNFTADSTNVIEGEAVQFYYNGTHGNYPLVYDWDFGDDTAHSNDENPLHLYAMNGTYMVNLTVIDANGDRVNLTRYDFITVDNLAPNLTFQESTVNVMVGQSIQFSYTLTSGNMPYTYSWNFGDGNISSDPHPWHQYETNGTFIVSLTVTDDDGDSVNASMTVHVEPARGGNPPRFPAEVLFSTFLVVGVATLGGIFTVKYKKKKSTALLTLGEYPSSGAKQAKNKGFLKAGSSTSHELLHESYVPGEISISTEQESSLKQQEELARTESEVDVQKQQFLCLVHKGPVEGVNIYLCPHCKAFYCRACVKALKEKGEKCWSCHQDFKL